MSTCALAVAITLSLWPRSPISLPHQIGDDQTHIFTYLNRKPAQIVLPALCGPVWNSGQRNPPLSVSTALDFAAKKRHDIQPDTDDWNWILDATELVPWEAVSGHWYWKFTFAKIHRTSDGDMMVAGHSGPPTEFVLVVLMDGTIIEPDYID